MVNCNECNKNFEENGIINECSECDEPFCNDCKEEHGCVCSKDKFSEHENHPCEDCYDYDEEMYQCDICNNYYCNSCQEEHITEENENIEFKSYDYEEYVKEKTVENL